MWHYAVGHKYDILELSIRNWRKKKEKLNNSTTKIQKSILQWNTEVSKSWRTLTFKTSTSRGLQIYIIKYINIDGTIKDSKVIKNFQMQNGDFKSSQKNMYLFPSEKCVSICLQLLKPYEEEHFGLPETHNSITKWNEFLLRQIKMLIKPWFTLTCQKFLQLMQLWMKRFT